MESKRDLGTGKAAARVCGRVREIAAEWEAKVTIVSQFLSGG
jgi:hypothetical protein